MNKMKKLVSKLVALVLGFQVWSLRIRAIKYGVVVNYMRENAEGTKNWGVTHYFTFGVPHWDQTWMDYGVWVNMTKHQKGEQVATLSWRFSIKSLWRFSYVVAKSGVYTYMEYVTSDEDDENDEYDEDLLGEAILKDLRESDLFVDDDDVPSNIKWTGERFARELLRQLYQVGNTVHVWTDGRKAYLSTTKTHEDMVQVKSAWIGSLSLEGEEVVVTFAPTFEQTHKIEGAVWTMHHTAEIDPFHGWEEYCPECGAMQNKQEGTYMRCTCDNS